MMSTQEIIIVHKLLLHNLAALPVALLIIVQIRVDKKWYIFPYYRNTSKRIVSQIELYYVLVTLSFLPCEKNIIRPTDFTTVDGVS